MKNSEFNKNLVSIKNLLLQSHERGFEDMLSMELWLAFLLKRDRKFIFLNPNFIVNKTIERIYWKGLADLIDGKPLAYLTGEKEFYGYSFIVNSDVLIPRPESELLVDLASKYLEKEFVRNPYREITVLDMGTGSGAIILSLLKIFHQIKGIGVDISSAALKIARKNALRYRLSDRVKFIKGDLYLPKTKCDIVLANLPYIGIEKFNFVANNVDKYEPSVALYGGKDGLQLYRKLFKLISSCSWSPDLFIGEFGFGQCEIMTDLLAKHFLESSIKIISDLAGIPRVFVVGEIGNIYDK